jgi:hypothetical protein
MCSQSRRQARNHQLEDGVLTLPFGVGREPPTRRRRSLTARQQLNKASRTDCSTPGAIVLAGVIHACLRLTRSSSRGTAGRELAVHNGIMSTCNTPIIDILHEFWNLGPMDQETGVIGYCNCYLRC